MAEDSKDNVSEVINAAANLAKAVPVYDDAIKPIAIETGKALGTVGKLVNSALAPLRGLVWGAEKIEAWVQSRVSAKLENVPPEKIISPDIAIAGPTISELKYRGHKPELSEMFASLFAGAMNSDTAQKAHPAFVGMISSMTPLDAKVFATIMEGEPIPYIAVDLKGKEGSINVLDLVSDTLFSANVFPSGYSNESVQKLKSSLNNLERMKLVDVNMDGYLSAPPFEKRYQELEDSEVVISFKEQLKDKNLGGRSIWIRKRFIRLTELGRDFSEVTLTSIGT